ncbi:hypothetical protein [Sediminibacillus halophilus]|uniref:Uncharacterized protein n=1 Tax=Sediminibacillus halophilus TaxID=482461 RepID=A0A1G9SWN8_9BACI|nr:hypothetical protein [Sediminibacillus halophilus]SDM39869.1 hypothetical protein SAMN05216244_2348 [Sediminibacillus halophilus]
MGTIIITLFSLYIAFYCGSFARTIYKEGNKQGAIAVGCLVITALASPYLFFKL